MSISSRLQRHLALASVVSASVTAASQAAVVRWNTNVAIPTNGSSLYVNCDPASRAFGFNGPALTGWDFALYCADQASKSLEGTCAPGAAFMRAPGPNGLYFGNLPDGTSVGETGSQFTAGAGLPWTAYFATPGLLSPGVWNLNSANYFGLKYRGDDGQLRYAYGCVTVGANQGIRTLSWIEYETTPNTPIAVVPAPGIACVAGLACVRGRRRRS